MMYKDSILSSQVYIRLTEFFFKCSKRDVNYLIAKVLIKKINIFPDILIEEIAYLATTTPSSVTKFCKRIGYQSFKEMRYDLESHNESSLFVDVRVITEKEGIDAGIDLFLKEEIQMLQRIYQLFDHEQSLRIATTLKYAKSAAMFTNTYSFSSANFFRELLSFHGIPLFEVDRKSELSLLQDMIVEVDYCFIISLTGEWLKENSELLSTIKESKSRVILLTESSLGEVDAIFDEVVKLEQFDFLFYSNFFSQKVLQSWFNLVVTSLSFV